MLRRHTDSTALKPTAVSIDHILRVRIVDRAVHDQLRRRVTDVDEEVGKHERAWYVVCVRGGMVVDWPRWFPGFSVTVDPDGNTVLSGQVVDRSAFYGLMSRVRDLGLTVISVEQLRGHADVSE